MDHIGPGKCIVQAVICLLIQLRSFIITFLVDDRRHCSRKSKTATKIPFPFTEALSVATKLVCISKKNFSSAQFYDAFIKEPKSVFCSNGKFVCFNNYYFQSFVIHI